MRIVLGLSIAAALLLGCDAETHIRLFEPVKATTPRGMDAGGAEPEPPLGPDPGPEAGPPPSDAALPTSRPDRELPTRRDSGSPPVMPPEAGQAQPGRLSDALVLQYDFTGSGEVVPDLVGEQDARLMGGAVLNERRVILDGVDDYVDIPNGVVSGLHSATFIVWLTWKGGVCWQRVFDFGFNTGGEDAVGKVVTSLFMTPKACGRETFMAMAELGMVKHEVFDNEPLPSGYAIQVALVVDGDNRTFTLYRDREKVAEAETQFQLGELTDANNWLGRSQWEQDQNAFFAGQIGEFRIYSRVLSAEEIAMVYAEGFPTP